MKKIIPPSDFFRYTNVKREFNPNEAKARSVEHKELGCSFLVLHLSNPITATDLTQELSRIFEKSYRQKTYRILCELTDLGVIRFRKLSDIDRNNPTDIEKEILKKHELFLSRIDNPWGNDYSHMVYYFVSHKGFEILEFVAKKYNFNIVEE